MYSRQYFVEQFRETDTTELIERYISSDLTDAAKDAIQVVLRERGVSEKDVAPLARQARKAKYRIAGVTNHCDFCGKSVLFSVSRVKNDGQKFCNSTCLRNARLMDIAC